jgi:hypothetical protein
MGVFSRPVKVARKTCDFCGDWVIIPPGVIYRGEHLHRQCAKFRAKEDLSDDVIGPIRDREEEMIQEVLDI